MNTLPTFSLSRNDIRHPKRLLPLMRLIAERQPLAEPSPEQCNIVACLCAMAAEESARAPSPPPPALAPASAEPSGTPRATVKAASATAVTAGISLSSALPRAKLTVYLAELANGGHEADALERSGLMWAEVRACEAFDKAGFAVLLRKARELKEAGLKEYSKDTLRRLIEGYEEPLVGRVGKDRDGVVAHRRKYSERATMFALERLSKTFQQPQGMGRGGGADVNVTYNITFNNRPPVGRGKPECQDAEVIGVQGAETGGTLAELADEL